MSAVEPFDHDVLLGKSSLLDFLAECDVPDHAPPLAVKQAPNKSWRQRRQEETVALREQVKLLETDLKRIKMAAGVLLTTDDTSSSSKEMVPVAAASVWSEIAARQSRNRLKSKTKNAELHELLKREVYQAKMLRRAFKKRLREHMPSVRKSMELVRSYQLQGSVRPPADNSVVFSDLLAGMDEIYAGLDDVFEAVKMQEIPCPGHRSDTETSRPKGMFLEFVDCYAVPFDRRQVEDAVWTVKTSASAGIGVVFAQLLEVDSNTRVTCVCACLPNDDVEILFTARSAVRKYVERGRAVFVTRMLLEPVYDHYSVSFKETTRLVVKRGHDSSLGPTTIMQTHSQVTDREDNPFTRARWKSSSYYVDGAAIWEKAITGFYHNVEDTLLGQPEAQGSSCPVGWNFVSRGYFDTARAGEVA